MPKTDSAPKKYEMLSMVTKGGEKFKDLFPTKKYKKWRKVRNKMAITSRRNNRNNN